MILINKNGLLKFNKKTFRCALGKNGGTKNKVEGDGCTPTGIFSFGQLYIRSDRIRTLETKFNYTFIKKTMAWSDNPKSKNYNKLVTEKDKSCEKLFRKDTLYDLVLVIEYNMNPVIPFKGSAIFLHVAKKNYKHTKGCIAVKKSDLLEILSMLKPSDKIKISYY